MATRRSRAPARSPRGPRARGGRPGESSSGWRDERWRLPSRNDPARRARPRHAELGGRAARGSPDGRRARCCRGRRLARREQHQGRSPTLALGGAARVGGARSGARGGST